MRRLILALVMLFAVGSVQAADKKLTPQQQKMATCSKENKGKQGSEYKQAMSDCMKRDVAAAPPTQQQKMAACSKANKGKKGDEYKQAMSACLAK
jgi:hypothetical protein